MEVVRGGVVRDENRNSFMKGGFECSCVRRAWGLLRLVEGGRVVIRCSSVSHLINVQAGARAPPLRAHCQRYDHDCSRAINGLYHVTHQLQAARAGGGQCQSLSPLSLTPKRGHGISDLRQVLIGAGLLDASFAFSCGRPRHSLEAFTLLFCNLSTKQCPRQAHPSFHYGVPSNVSRGYSYMQPHTFLSR